MEGTGKAEQQAQSRSQARQMSVSREEPESTWTVTSLCDLTADYGTQEQNPQVYPRRVNQGEIKLFLLK